MLPLTHGFKIEADRCNGCLACMRICPTHAIRVKNGKARYEPGQCIDCGSCLTACRYGAITATTLSSEDLFKFQFKVAVPSPVLFGQFPAGITPDHIHEGLHWLGFDAVWDYGVDLILAGRAITRYLADWKGTFPLISTSCPVIVRLVQVSYPRMVDQLVQVQIPREIAGREAKRRYSEELSLSPDQVGVIYITPCQAKTISILQPAEGVESYLDGALGINAVYNGILAYANLHREDGKKPSPRNLIRNSTMLQWSLSEGLGRILSHHQYLHVTGLPNIIQVFDDIEKGKLRNVEFLEAFCCWSGCTGGNLTVANIYVTLSKFYTLISQLPETDPQTEAEVERRFPLENLSLDRPIRPRPVKGMTGDLRERVRIMQKAEEILNSLPGLDCGLCGAPTCKVLARDASLGEAVRTDCVFYSKERLRDLQKRHIRKGRPGPKA
ncbi:MAG: [Fe-Fe] hydrogenase large subunit C-terminal domain-containing protein [Candidatus Aminicenantales bacterium]